MKIKNGDYIKFKEVFFGRRIESKGWVKEIDIKNQTVYLRRDDRFMGACATTISRRDVLDILPYKPEPPE
jgi:hypothetical protein